MSDDDLIGVGVDDEVRIVRNHDHLAMRLGLDEETNKFLKDRFRVKVFFRLINDQRSVVAVIQREVEQQQHNSAGARRQLAYIDAIIFDPITNGDVIRAEQPLRETF